MHQAAPVTRPRPFARKGGERYLYLDGTVVSVLAGAADTGGRFTLLECLAHPGPTDHLLHAHDREDEALYVLEGAMTCHVGGQRVAAPTGALVVLPRGVPHAVGRAGAGPARALVLLVPGGHEEYLRSVGLRLGDAAGADRAGKADCAGSAERAGKADCACRASSRLPTAHTRAAAARHGLDLLLLPGRVGRVGREV